MLFVFFLSKIGRSFEAQRAVQHYYGIQTLVEWFNRNNLASDYHPFDCVRGCIKIILIVIIRVEPCNLC